VKDPLETGGSCRGNPFSDPKEAQMRPGGYAHLVRDFMTDPEGLYLNSLGR